MTDQSFTQTIYGNDSSQSQFFIKGTKLAFSLGDDILLLEVHHEEK